MYNNGNGGEKVSYYKKAKHSHNEDYSVMDVLEIILIILGGVFSIIGVAGIAVLILITV